MNRLLIFGLGYCGRAVAQAAAGFVVTATSRSPDRPGPFRPGHLPRVPSLPGGPVEPGHDGKREGHATGRPFVDRYAVERGHDEGEGTVEAVTSIEALPSDAPGAATIALVSFDAAEAAIATATHILMTAAPGEEGDPALARYTPAIRAAVRLRWIGYLSSTVVYGNRDGAWVDEDTPPAPSQPRGQRRLAAEQAWSAFADRCAVDIFRLAGIYGPGRSAFDDFRDGTARRTVKPGHQFGRIHRDDIGRAVATAMRQDRAPGVRVLNLADDEPSESALVVEEAARLLGVPPPAAVTFDALLPTLSPMARSFWSEDRKVASQKTQQALDLRWLYPDFRHGLAAILRQERGEGPL